MPVAVIQNRAQVLRGPKELLLISSEISPPAPDEVQIAIRSTTLCGSDLHYYKHYANGDARIREPLSQGHEAAGEIVSVGKTITHLKVGDRVALEVGVPCDQCEECEDGRYNVCAKLRFRSSAFSFPHYQGTLQERVNHPAKWCHLLPEGMTLDEGALLEPLSVAVHALRKAAITPKSNILVIGAGAVGLLCAAAAKVEGCHSVTIADIALNRLQFALQNKFADAVYQVPPKFSRTTEDMLSTARDTAAQLVAAKNKAHFSEGNFHVTFECTGVQSSVQNAIYATRNGGKVLLVGMGTPIQTLPVGAAALREVDLLGVWRYAHTYPKAIEIMQQAGKTGLPDIKSVITHRFQGLETVPEAFEIASKTQDGEGRLVIKVVVNN